MLRPADALAAAGRPAAAVPRTRRRALVVGGGGPLGSQVLERLLAAGPFDGVGVLVSQPLQPALRGLRVVADGDEAAWAALAPDTAVIVFDRARHAGGREAAFVRPEPAALPAWAARLQAHGVRSLIVVVPHTAGLLPTALKAGLASLDEGAVAALGFEHLVFMRPAQGAAAAPVGSGLPSRLAHGLLAQLNWLVPQGDQPVRSATVARVAARLAAVLPDHATGTRVLPPAWLWAAAQRPASDAVVDDWLAGRPLPAAADHRRW